VTAAAGLLLFVVGTPVALWALEGRSRDQIRGVSLRRQREHLQEQIRTVEDERTLALLLLAKAHNDAGKALLEARRYDEAGDHFAQGLRTFGELERVALDDPEAQFLLAAIHNNAGHVQRQTGKADEARASHDKARKILESLQPVRRNAEEGGAELARAYAALAALEPEEARRTEWRFKRLTLLVRTGDYRVAADDAQEVARMRLTGEQQYDLTCLLARCAGRAAGDEEQPLAARVKGVESWSRQALELLRAAQKGGHFKDEARREALKLDPDLDALRERDDFKGWLDGV
jgi:tetratricopeptide (TPR) repeat protein